MPLSEFWHGDMGLLGKYQIAYLRKVDFEAWKNGFYTHIGISVALENSFRKKGSKPIPYPHWQDLTITKKEKKKVTKENIEQVFRQEQIDNNNWLRKFLNKNKG